MNYTTVQRRTDVSPAYLTEIREIFLPLEYLKPRHYLNACRYKNLRRIEDNIEHKIYDENWIQKFVDVSENDIYVTVTMDNIGRLDIIANEYYHNPNFWWVIALANQIIDPFDIELGTELRIPPILSLYNQGGVLSGN